MRHIQVLTPIKKGTIGVHNLNAELQKTLNPENRNKKEKVCANYTFREGDRVMQIKNNYNLCWEKTGNGSEVVDGIGVFNGDTGIIQTIDNVEQKVVVFFEDEKTVEYDYSILEELEPAFAVTIHKSQGSEFPVVIIPVYPGPQVLMTRNLLYTAVTRAKDLAIIVGTEKTLFEMIQNEKETFRFSGLSDKLKNSGLFIE
jgi:exodeoxyribonuclease V alpha subunit